MGLDSGLHRYCGRNVRNTPAYETRKKERQRLNPGGAGVNGNDAMFHVAVQLVFLI
jgi:hypothetical protein